uniref:Uncharacterized protein LOC104234665 n=1 Tax=Nicotiana sylvestris TaxID=4096 RepID=A0A1U7X6T5_NICSY|nr:PREDICTED: uncharacterized protein LOC104234665 [Nicotiana sylvestris]
MGSLAHLDVGQRPLAREVHQLASLGVYVMVSSEGGVIVRNRAESSLMVEIKEKQYNDPISVQLKEGIHIHKTTAFSLGIDDGTLRYQGRLCVPNEDGLQERIMAEAHISRYSMHPGSTKIRCRPLIGWFEVGEAKLIGPDLGHQAMEKVKIIKERSKTAQSHQKPYSDVRRRDLEFKEDDWVFLKVYPMKGIMRFGNKGKLSSRYVGPYRIIQRIGQVAFKLELPPEMSLVHPIFHVSMLKKVVRDSSAIVPVETIEDSEELSYEEISIAILDRQVRNLRNKEIASVNVLW